MSIPKPLMSLALLLILLTHMFTASKFTFTPKKIFISCISSVFLPMSLPLLSPVSPAYAKTELPSLEKCFNAIKTELDPVKGESIKRIKNDINNDDWEDLKLFTREYDAGFRGGVLKSAWKQLEGDDKKNGISISNSFTFDLIALNKAARNKDKESAVKVTDSIILDLKNFLKLQDNL